MFKLYGNQSGRIAGRYSQMGEAPYPTERIRDIRFIGFPKRAFRAGFREGFPISEIRQFDFTSLYRNSEIEDSSIKLSSFRIKEVRKRKADFGKSYFRILKSDIGNRISVFGYPLSFFSKRKSDNRNRNAGMGNPNDEIRFRKKEILNHLSLIRNRFSLILLPKEYIRFIKSFFAEILHSSEFSFTTSCIRHRNHEFRLPISEIRNQPRRGT